MERSESMMKLRPCPFCGSEDVDLLNREYKSYAKCWNCRAEGPIVETVQLSRGQSLEAKAVELWNERASDDVMLDVASEIEASEDPCLQWLVELLREEAGR